MTVDDMRARLATESAKLADSLHLIRDHEQRKEALLALARLATLHLQLASCLEMTAKHAAQSMTIVHRLRRVMAEHDGPRLGSLFAGVLRRIVRRAGPTLAIALAIAAAAPALAEDPPDVFHCAKVYSYSGPKPRTSPPDHDPQQYADCLVLKDELKARGQLDPWASKGALDSYPTTNEPPIPPLRWKGWYSN